MTQHPVARGSLGPIELMMRSRSDLREMPVVDLRAGNLKNLVMENSSVSGSPLSKLAPAILRLVLTLKGAKKSGRFLITGRFCVRV